MVVAFMIFLIKWADWKEQLHLSNPTNNQNVELPRIASSKDWYLYCLMHNHFFSFLQVDIHDKFQVTVYWSIKVWLLLLI